MSRIWIVKKGKHFMGKTTTVHASCDYSECVQWIYENLNKGDHMYIEEVPKLTRKHTREMLEYAGFYDKKGEKS